MPAELDRNEATGVGAVFSVRESMWHGDGVVIAQAPNLDEAMRLSGTNFEVALKPLFMDSGADGENGRFVATATGRAVVRLDRFPSEESVLAVVGDGYAPLQNGDAFRTLEPLLDQGLAELATGGALRGGRDVWMQVKFNIDHPVVQEVFARLGVQPFGALTNNHSSQRRAILLNTPVRIVCANTLRAALGSSEQVAVVHRGDARVRLIEAAKELWGGIIERHVALAEQFTRMKETILSVEQFTESVLAVAAPLPAEPSEEEKKNAATLRGYERSVDNARLRRSALERAWWEGDGHLGDGSAWEAYNGAVQVMDHDGEAFRVRGSRLEALLDGSLGRRKEEVYESVLAVCNTR